MPNEAARHDRASRIDRWGTQATLVAVTLLVAGAQVGAPLWRWATGADLRLVVDGDTAGLPAEGDVDEVEAVLRTGGDAAVRLVDLLPGLATVLVFAAGAWLVLRLVGDVMIGTPFAERNVRRLRWLAGLLLVGPVVLAYVEMACHQVVLHLLDLDQGAASLEIPGWGLVIGLVCMVLAQAFAAGTRLQRDTEGLV